LEPYTGNQRLQTAMRKQTKRSISGKKRWAAMSAEQKQVILDRLKNTEIFEN